MANSKSNQAEQDLKHSLDIWPSVARIIATFGITLFHYLGQIEHEKYCLDFYSILVFCFLSGYLSRGRHVDRKNWLLRRYFSIMVPYWMVIIPVTAANFIGQYKSISMPSLIITLLGGNLFLKNPLYVVAWYITFVLLLYVYAYLELFFSKYLVIIPMCLGLLAFVPSGHAYYFGAFLAGLRLCDLKKREISKVHNAFLRSISVWLFNLQKYCYPFFLIHGAVLLLFFKKTSLSDPIRLVLTLIISSVMSIIVHRISKSVASSAADRSKRLLDTAFAR